MALTLTEEFDPATNLPRDVYVACPAYKLTNNTTKNTITTCIKATPDGNYEVYSTNRKVSGAYGTQSTLPDQLVYSYNASNNTYIFNTADGYSLEDYSGDQLTNINKRIKTDLYTTIPVNSARNLSDLPGYKSIANSNQPRVPIVDPRVPIVDPSESASLPLIYPEDRPDQIEADNKKDPWRGKIYRYPTKIDDNKQDFIKFEVYDYKTRKPSKENPLIQEKNRGLGSSIATIVLPIQPSITDNNTVDWNGFGLNPVELAGYGLSSAAISGGSNGNDFSEILGKLGNTVTNDPNAQKAILLYLKQRAIGVNGLLSRFGGAIVNPNIELLFQGPQLRPFNFSFRLSPRDRDEAKQVKSIIRVFKEAMSVKTASGGLFLATPNVFKIKYINGTTKEEHTSLNKIKTCALQSCSVDYTPDGSYMTFNDINSGYPMTSYNLTLQFQELEPVTDNDYKSLTDVTTIGY